MRLLKDESITILFNSKENVILRYDFKLFGHLNHLEMMEESYVQVLINLDQYLHFLYLLINHITKKYSIRERMSRMITVYRLSRLTVIRKLLLHVLARAFLSKVCIIIHFQTRNSCLMQHCDNV